MFLIQRNAVRSFEIRGRMIPKAGIPGLTMIIRESSCFNPQNPLWTPWLTTKN